jgi:hypothetical protein
MFKISRVDEVGDEMFTSFTETIEDAVSVVKKFTGCPDNNFHNIKGVKLFYREYSDEEWEEHPPSDLFEE